MHTLNLKKFFIPSLIWNWDAKTQPVFTKILKNIFSIEGLDSACSKSPHPFPLGKGAWGR